MPLLKVNDLKTHYPIRGGFFKTVKDHVRAVDGVSFELQAGETYGLVGESGCGKTTTGRTIIGLNKATSGEILFNGTDLTKLTRKDRRKYTQDIQMIFQDAHSSLNPRKRVSEILAEPLRNFMKLTPDEERRRINELLAIVGMPEDVKLKYPHEFSGGQKQRIGIARAIATNPKLIIADEPVSALDLSVQAQVLNFMKDIQQELGLTYLFISHDLGVVKHMCDEINIMYKGRFVETGSRDEIYHTPEHIYTKRLLSAIPNIEPSTRVERKIERQRVEANYQSGNKEYFDENGRVFDLRPISGTHQVAMTASEQGGN